MLLYTFLYLLTQIYLRILWNFRMWKKGYLLFLEKRINTSKSLRAKRFMQRKIVLKNINKETSSAIGIAVRILMIENKSFIFCCLKEKSYFMLHSILRITITLVHWVPIWRRGKCVVCTFMINAFYVMFRLAFQYSRIVWCLSGNYKNIPVCFRSSKYV